MFLETQTPGKAETKADPFSLESLIAWLAKQPADKVYDWTDWRRCGVAQYLLAHGAEAQDTQRLRANHVNWIRVFCGGNWPNDTFGEALIRAREELA